MEYIYRQIKAKHW